MKIKPLFDNVSDVNIHSYLEKCGIDDVKGYLKGNSIEPTINYDNIDKAKELILKYTKEGGYNINQE